MEDEIPLVPITLPRWPSSGTCIASSEDDIAVACGENIHFLRLTRDGHELKTSWRVSTVRVNQFPESQWPFQQLASTKHFSLGEEQSDSNVIDLAWSPTGLGPHKRAVLAVLTSNLVLSLWESDGSPGKYQRTCIVNKFLPATTRSESSSEESRRSVRIRAFAWNSMLAAGMSRRHGQFFLTIADDHAIVHVFQVAKSSDASFGQFNFVSVAELPLIDISLSDILPSTTSPLQKKLHHESTVSKIIASDWELVPSPDSAPQKSICTLDIGRGPVTYRLSLKASVTRWSNVEPQEVEDSEKRGILLTLQPTEGARSKESQTKPISQDTAQTSHPDLDQLFKAALKPLTRAFDEEHQLFGHYKVRWWGSCPILNTNKMAACVTLHPSDMIEHTQPSVEKCTVIFTELREPKTKVAKPANSTIPPHEQIIKYAVSELHELPLSISDLDLSVLMVLRDLASQSVAMLTEVKELEAALRCRTNVSVDNTGNTAPNQIQDAGESCTFCTAKIPFSSDTSSAKCLSGHLFTRCNLTFLAIQEPGISKYCSGCDRQFLHQSRLEMEDGLSLVKALFEEFDVCPYCSAKFRG